MFIILVFRFEIFRALEVSLNRKDKIVGLELGGSD